MARGAPVRARSVVITGIGLACPLGASREEVFAGLLAGRSALARRPEFPGGCSARAPGSPPWSRPGRALGLAAQAARRALGDAGLPEGALSGTGLVLGTIVGEAADGMAAERPGSAPGRRAALLRAWSLSALAHRVARRLRLGGLVVPVSTACASGLDAVGLAAREVASGRARAVVGGGVETLGPFQWEGFRRLGALDPVAVRPFDRRRAGTGLGEGACFWVLEEEGSARERGAAVLGRIRGWATCTDAHSLVAPHPEGRGLLRAAERALSESRSDPAGLALVVAHATGTPANDRAEAAALRRLFGGPLPERVAVTGLKGALGHCLGAAGTVEASCALWSLAAGVAPPVTGLAEPDPGLGLRPVVGEPKPLSGTKALCVAAGFGGQNSALVLEGAPP